MFTDANGKCDIHANADGNCYYYANSNPYAYTQCYTNGHSYGYCKTDAHCSARRNAKATSEPSAATESVVLRRQRSEAGSQ